MIPAVTVDIGTTSVKLGLFDSAGVQIDASMRPTPTTTDAFGEIYDVAALRLLVDDFFRGLDPSRRASVRRIAIAGVGESGGLVRPDLSLASPMILWHDHRGASYLRRLGTADRTRVYEVTGLPVNANYGLSKVAWALDHADESAGAQWLTVADYLAAILTGERRTEPSLASRTLALDLSTRDWSAEITGLLGVDVGVFPALQQRGGRLVLPDVAYDLGLAADVRITVAGHDHMVGAVGAGLLRGELLNSTGTTEGLLMLGDAPALDASAEAAQLANGLACDGPGFTLFASIPTGGSAFATLQSMLGMTAGRLSARIADIHDRYLADTLDLDAAPVVVPWFRGSPPPDKNADARGVVAGLSSHTTADDLILGTFLGMVLQFRDVLALFPERPERIKVIGPAARNPLWLSLKADILGMPLSVAQASEVVSRGAQALASGATPAWSEVDPFDVAVNPGRSERLAAWSTDIAPVWARLTAVAQ